MESGAMKQIGRAIGANGQWHEEARELRKAGWLLRDIAAKFCVSISAVHTATNAEARKKATEFSREYHRNKYGVDKEWTERQLAAHRRWKTRRKETRA